MTASGRLSKYGLRFVALFYLTALLLLPIGVALVKTFEDGIGEVIKQITEPDAIHALKMSLLTVIIAVPLNTVFGIAAAHVVVRTKFRFKWAINALIDMPFAVSPVVIGLALVLVYGTGGWFGADLAAMGIQVIFSTPGIVMAVIFVSLPFVAREVIPVMQGNRDRPGNRRRDAWRQPLADLPQDHPARDPLGRDLRNRADHSPRPGRVRRGDGRLRKHLRRNPDPAALRIQTVRNLQLSGRLFGFVDPRRPCAGHPAFNEPATPPRGPR